MSTRLRVLLILAALISAPVTYDFGSQRLKANDASCQMTDEGGTCCTGTGTCYPGTCSSSSCAQAYSYWKSDGAC
jgi:hypothetical protein